MHKIVSVKQMREIEQQVNNQGLKFAQMIKNAGEGLADSILDDFQDLDKKNVLGLVGGGNNGGDTLVALTRMHKAGWQARAFLVKDSKEKKPLIEAFLKEGGEIVEFDKDNNFKELDAQISQSQILIDGLLGTGAKLPMRGHVLEILRHLSSVSQLPYIVAVDCPSGMDCDTGEISEYCLTADWTITMAAVKVGLLKFPAIAKIGKLTVVDIGLPENLPDLENIDRFILDEGYVKKNLPKRPLNSHKGSFGTVLNISGSRQYPGAALLSGKAAYRVGAGLVNIAAKSFVQKMLAGDFPEAVWTIIQKEKNSNSKKENQVITDKILSSQSVLIGPGLGTSDQTKDFIKDNILSIKSKSEFLNDKGNPVTFVFDADALNILSEIPEFWKLLPAHSVLTPHPGEFSRLSGLSINDIQKNRVEIAKEYARKWNAVVVLKGALTVVASDEKEAAVNPVASSALAKAGTGDVLAGMIAGFTAQSLDVFTAACVSVWLHSQAGIYAADFVGDPAGVLASDLLDAIPEVLSLLN